MHSTKCETWHTIGTLDASPVTVPRAGLAVVGLGNKLFCFFGGFVVVIVFCFSGVCFPQDLYLLIGQREQGFLGSSVFVLRETSGDQSR